MHKRTISALRIAVVAALAVVSMSFGQTLSTITVSDPRALAQAALQLERHLGIAINYEDVPYAYGGDISDVAETVMTPAQKAAHPAAHILVPRGGQISVDLSHVPGVAQQPGHPPASVGNASPLVDTLIAEHARQGFPGVYRSTLSNGAFYITPMQVRDASGALINVLPALDTKVTLPLKDRTAAETLEAVLQQVSQGSGGKIGLGSAPLNLMLSAHVNMTAASETARSVLGRMFLTLASQTMPDGSVASGLAYHLYYDPGLKYYMLNVHKVPGPQSSVAPVQAQPAAATPSGGNPYGKKK